MITVIEKYRVVNGDKVLEKSIEVGKQEKADKKELQALFNNIQELMEENALNPDNKKYDKHIKGMVVEGIYFGEYTLTVKQLLTIWSNNIWRDGNKFYYRLGGSPLSGMSFWDCYDIKEKKFGTDEGRGFMDKVRQIMPYTQFKLRGQYV